MTDWRLVNVAKDFRDALGDLAEVTSETTVAFEGGNYQRLYIKPHYKLGSSLLTSRELLVLIADFPEMQARAIKLAEAQLRIAAGRLEPGLVTIVHRDPAGNTRLQDWGRERGLTILPVDISDGMPVGPDLEARLCRALYSHDPFDLTGPVRGSHQFFGRAYVPDLTRRLRQGHIQALFGIRKIGKTSVLHRILDEALNFHGMVCAMLDCSDDSLSALNAGPLLYSIGGALNDALSSDTSYTSVIPLGEGVDAPEAARVFLNLITSADRPIVLLIDEVDSISPSSAVAPHWRQQFNPFFRALRSVYQEAARRELAFSIVICGVSSYWFSVDEIDGVENAALALVPEGYLAPFDRVESRQMVQTLGRSAGLVFRDEVADEVAATCSDIPFWIRKAGSYINSCYANDSRPVTVDYTDCKTLCDEFVEVEGAQLAFSSVRHLFRIYPELGEAAAVLGTSAASELPQSLVSSLGRYGLVDERLGPSGPMVDVALARWRKDVTAEPPRLPLDGNTTLLDPPSAISAGSLSAAGEEEWADLLGEVSRRRNVLERRLRDFVLVVLRSECANRDDKKPNDVVLSALAADRRSALAGKNSAALLRALYWLELVTVIKKNWPWFEKFFADRKQVELFAEIINDRPDAHAKPIDGAELALQRRAIGWFDERLDASGIL